MSNPLVPTDTFRINGWSVTGAATHHEAIDETAAAANDADYVAQRVTSRILQLECSDGAKRPNTNAGWIIRLRAWYEEPLPIPANEQKVLIALFDSGAPGFWVPLTDVAITTSPTTYDLALDPNDVAPIAQTDLDNLRLYVSSPQTGSAYPADVWHVSTIELRLPGAGGEKVRRAAAAGPRARAASRAPGPQARAAHAASPRARAGVGATTPTLRASQPAARVRAAQAASAAARRASATSPHVRAAAAATTPALRAATAAPRIRAAAGAATSVRRAAPAAPHVRAAGSPAC